jgi:polyhydroxyalkanoate synthesis regulator phasin
MIRNISIALLSALMAYLLSSTENNMNAFALVVSALAFTLGYIAANESRKQTERTETAMRSLKESIDTQNEALKSSLTDFGKQTTNAITTLKSSFDDLKNVAVKFYSSTEEILVKMSESLISANNKLSDIARVTINSEGSGSKVEDAIREVKGEISKVASPDILDDLKDAINKLQNSADDIPEKIERSLNKIEQNLSVFYETANSEGREEIKKGMDDIRDDFNKAIEDLSEIAVKFTDYEKEKDIIQRLEKLCK